MRYETVWSCVPKKKKKTKFEKMDIRHSCFTATKWAILCLKMAHPDNSGSDLRILLKFFKMKEVIGT